MTTMTLTAPNSSRRMLLLVAAVFFLPFIIGSGLFWLDWRPEKFSNHGELLQPARTLPVTGLTHADGRALPTSELTGKWLIALPVVGACSAACEGRVQQMQRVNAALSKDQNRFKRILFSFPGGGAAQHANATLAADLQRRFPELVVVAVNVNATEPWHKALESQGDAVFVIDPLGNVMMRYTDANDSRGLLKDMERLLKYSWIR